MSPNSSTDLDIPANIPQYVLDHAPLLHLSSQDRYKPIPLTTHLARTSPQSSFHPVSLPTAEPLTLSNLSLLNDTPGTNGGKDVYLTSVDDITTSPSWLEGIAPDESGRIVDGGDEGKTGVVIVVEKEEGGEKVTDVFYFYFWGFNWGGVVLGKQLGDHVGDWEHNMIRFVNGKPKAVWYSQHSNGEAFTFKALKKDGSGKRPIVYAANGSHALYPTPGTHDHTIPNLNLPAALLLVDTTDPGPLYDPILNSYFYAYSTTTKTFTPYIPPSSAQTFPEELGVPVDFLYYKGHWGDQQYPDSDKRQDQLVGNRKYVSGPTGPMDKQLERKEVWPENEWSKGQRVRGWVGLWVYGPSMDFVSQVLGWFRCGGRGGKGKGRRVFVSGEVVK